MPETPFELLRCSWPRPVRELEGRWVSPPDWDAPAMPRPPRPRWETVQGERCWHVDWCESFRDGLTFWPGHQGGEMRGFHLVFRIRVNGSGTLVFWDDDGSVIRREGRVVHDDRTAHAPARAELSVRAGDLLEVAQWQRTGGWTWGARLLPADDAAGDAVELLAPFRDAIRSRFARPEGPPLKVYCSGGTPVRSAVAIYSMVLNGYTPAEVLVFGEYQWSEAARRLLQQLLPFARVVPTDVVLGRLRDVSGARLAELALRHWTMMKTCVGLIMPPGEYCMMDDDVFILDSTEEALGAFVERDLVFAPDADYSEPYAEAWHWLHGRSGSIPTGRLNTGLYWLRHKRDPVRLAADLLEMTPGSRSLPNWLWEQGFLASQFANESVQVLPSQRYFYPYFDGLPGGPLGYDYAGNPCGFVSIHFGGLAEKLGDDAALSLAPALLGRSL